VSQDIAKFQKTGQTPIIFKGNGTISYRSTRASFSDVRLKENIINCSPKLLDLLKIRVVDFKFKGTDNSTHIGVIAQELETLFPDLVSDIYPSQQDIKLGKTEIYKAVKYSSFDVILIKAFQEQLAIINNLTLQLDEIESKCKLLKTLELETVILNQDLDFLKQENDVFKQNINEILKLMNK
jgi:ribosomal protein L1